MLVAEWRATAAQRAGILDAIEPGPHVFTLRVLVKLKANAVELVVRGEGRCSTNGYVFLNPAHPYDPEVTDRTMFWDCAASKVTPDS